MTHRDENSPLRAALTAIDAAHPLVAPMNGNAAHSSSA